jgi:hypothetical protein
MPSGYPARIRKNIDAHAADFYSASRASVASSGRPAK